MFPKVVSLEKLIYSSKTNLIDIVFTQTRGAINLFLIKFLKCKIERNSINLNVAWPIINIQVKLRKNLELISYILFQGNQVQRYCEKTL